MLLRLSQVPDYLYREYSVIRGPRVVRNWVNTGLIVKDRRIKLRAEKDQMGEWFTRTEWFTKFIEKVSTR